MTADTEYEIPAGEAGIDPGTYFATLTKLEPFTLYETASGWSRTPPEDGAVAEAYHKIEWTFHTEDGEQVDGTTSTARSERSTLYAWATGLGLAPAVVLDRSKPIPASQLIGRSALITVELDKNGYSRVKAVVQAPKQKATPAAQPGEFDGAPRQQPMAAPTDDLPF